MKKDFFKLAAIAGILVQTFAVRADVVPNSLFSNHAVLQRNMIVPVWGTARDGEKVTVEFAGQKAETVASNGKWMVKLKQLKAGGPFTMNITGDNSTTITDILVGEVWVCSGQSNMAMRLSPAIVNGAQEIADASYPEIRQYFVPRKSSQEPVADIGSSWQLCTPENARNFTAVGYFFARDLYKKLHIPFGIISSSVGGTPAEHWTSREALAGNAELKKMVDSYDQSVTKFPENLEKYKKDEPALLARYALDVETAKNENKPAPRKPAAPQHPSQSGAAGGLYTAMIRPLQPYAIKGTIWYQGEANSSRAKQYQTLFPLMIADWRKAWSEGDFPFLFVQIAPYKDISPDIREAQLVSWQKTPHTAMVVITDCGNAQDIHPTLKQPVGARLALAARALAYNEKVEYSGPVYKSMKIKDAKVILQFNHAKKLMAKGDQLKGFVIAGADKNFVEANAEIKKNKLVLSNPAIKAPVAVRYGWANVPDVNLYNEQELPATPFRTDIDQ